MDLAGSRPARELASTGYCLAVPGRDYLAYLPDGGRVELELTGARGRFAVEWAHPITGAVTAGDIVEGGARRTLEVPFGGDAVVYLRASE
jgi:hypothetical protein